MTSERVQMSRAFMSHERDLERVYFYTSSTEKYLQARRYFDQRGLLVDYFRSRTDPYDEDESGSSIELLTKALSDVVAHIGAGSLIFIEDTSVRIEALSTPDRDFPGLKVKEWFANTTFEECDGSILEAGGDRRATVKSDIALHVPGLGRPVFFHGETQGSVAVSSPKFAANPQYPWLTPKTFNGWFVPEGCAEPLGALSPELAWSHDFRVRAFSALIARLEEYAAALNLPPSAYRRRRRLRLPQDELPQLFGSGQNQAAALLVIGRTCAGKTTLAEYVSGRHGLLSIEASAVVRSLGVPREESDDADGFSYAMRVLDTLGHDVVSREIVERFGASLDDPFVISGLRDTAEIRFMRQAVPRSRIVLVEASERARFDRHLRRGRPGAEQTLADFRRRDKRQDLFGVLPVADDLADIRIANEGRIEDYHAEIDVLLAGRPGLPGLTLDAQPRHRPEQNQLYRSLGLLRAAESPLQCDEIEALSQENGGSRIRHNNANKVLRGAPALARRLDPGGVGDDSARVRYAITPSGLAYLELMSARPHYGE